MGYVSNAAGVVDEAFLAGGHFTVDVAGDVLAATPHLKAPYDPKSLRIKA